MKTDAQMPELTVKNDEEETQESRNEVGKRVKEYICRICKKVNKLH